jgi:hypothetical protein
MYSHIDYNIADSNNSNNLEHNSELNSFKKNMQLIYHNIFGNS